MCGRFTLTSADLDAIARELEARIAPQLAQAHRPRFNVGPTMHHVVITRDGENRQIRAAQWGFSRPGATSQPPLINARSETAAEKNTFRAAFATGRCGVITDGFFEWGGAQGRRTPHWFRRPDGGVLILAGLLRHHPGNETPQFVILTTESNRTLSKVHDRMPVVIPPEQLATWLAPVPSDPAARLPFLEALEAQLAPAPDDALVGTPVSTRVNDVRNDDPGCLQADSSPAQLDLLPG